jgi:nitrogen fixation protein FixH
MSAQLSSNRTERPPREITGRMVLICLIAFFAVVVGVNMIMVRAAISTFGGLETESSYKAGLAFGGEIAAAQAQEARHWQVAGKIFPASDGTTAVAINAQDAVGRPLTGLDAVVRLAHPTDRRLDHTLVMRENAPGQFRGTTASAMGEWDLVIELSRGEERLFRSRNRVSVR